jgi:hypothetical protein
VIAAARPSDGVGVSLRAGVSSLVEGIRVSFGLRVGSRLRWRTRREGSYVISPC